MYSIDDLEAYIKGFCAGTCNKCGKKITIKNSALLLQEVVEKKFLGIVSDRHLWPTAEGCIGSPGIVKLVLSNKDWHAAYEFIRIL